MQIGLIIPTYNRIEKLKECLISVFSQEFYEKKIDLFICIVNDGSVDGTSDYLKEIQFRNVYYIDGDSNWYFTKCVNEGFIFFEKFNLDFYMILNDDCVLSIDYFSNFYDSVIVNGLKDFIMGPLTLTSSVPTLVQSSGLKKILFFFKREYYIKLFSIFKNEVPIGIKSSLLLPGRGMIFSTNVYFILGGFDSGFLQYHSDEDYCFKARKFNIPIFINFDLRIFNDHLSTSESTSFKSPNFRILFKSIFDPKSRNYFYDRSKIIWRYYPKVLYPFLISFQYLIIFKSIFRGK